MKIPKFSNEVLNNQFFDINAKNKDKVKTPKKKNTLPFMIFDFDKNKIFPNISNKVSNANTLINSQTDKLLINGFVGSEEDFNKCYHKQNSPVKIKKIANIKIIYFIIIYLIYKYKNLKKERRIIFLGRIDIME